MPISGTLDVGPRLDRAPLVTALAGESVVLEGAEVLYLLYEISGADRRSLLPPALHPTDPPVVTFVVWRVPSGSLGPFSLAQVRVGCRAGVRPRGYLVGAAVSGEAGVVLAERWGFACVPGEVGLEHRYHEVVANVRLAGHAVLDAALTDPEPVSGADVLWTASMHLARVRRDGGAQPRLVQVDPEYTFHLVERGRPRLQTFDAAAFGDERVRPVQAVSASWARCDIVLPRIRYVCDPDRPALQGTERVG